MKNIITTLVSFVIFCSGITAQTQKPYFATEGTELNYIHYNASGKSNGHSTKKVEKSYLRDGKLFAEMSDIAIDNKNDKNGSSEEKVESMAFFADGITTYVFDIERMAASNPEMKQTFSEEGVSFTVAELDIPEKMKPGTKLPNREIEIVLSDDIRKEAGSIDMSIVFCKRKFHKYETVVVPGGEFIDCAKISYDVKFKMSILSKKVASVTEWYAPGIGLVKSEAMANNEKASTVLSSVTYP